jgi:hypothetical protein
VAARDDLENLRLTRVVDRGPSHILSVPRKPSTTGVISEGQNDLNVHHSHDAAMTSTSRTCTSSSSPLVCCFITSGFLSNHNIVACECLIRREFSPDELPSLINRILFDGDEDQTMRALPVDDAGALIDVLYDVFSTSLVIKDRSIETSWNILGTADTRSLTSVSRKWPEVIVSDMWFP